jgi:hypothetical protein
MNKDLSLADAAKTMRALYPAAKIPNSLAQIRMPTIDGIARIGSAFAPPVNPKAATEFNKTFNVPQMPRPVMPVPVRTYSQASTSSPYFDAGPRLRSPAPRPVQFFGSKLPRVDQEGRTLVAPIAGPSMGMNVPSTSKGKSSIDRFLLVIELFLSFL